RALAGELGLDGDRLLDAAASDEVRRAYEAGTEEAIARGVFGAPTYILEDEIFWGQDRLDFLARSLGLEWA
ncbi:MAG: DsbA family protein, partial [Alphaproteobacteria bacterium]